LENCNLFRANLLSCLNILLFSAVKNRDNMVLHRPSYCFIRINHVYDSYSELCYHPTYNEPVTKGLYHYSRNPQYLTEFLMFIGVSIASASWIFLLFSIVYEVSLLSFASSEERFCLEKYGDAYREYMNRTPRYIGIPKSKEK